MTNLQEMVTLQRGPCCPAQCCDRLHVRSRGASTAVYTRVSSHIIMALRVGIGFVMFHLSRGGGVTDKPVLL